MLPHWNLGLYFDIMHQIAKRSYFMKVRGKLNFLENFLKSAYFGLFVMILKKVLILALLSYTLKMPISTIFDMKIVKYTKKT